MTSERPTISVIIPVYNAERYLAEAIASVLAQHLLPDEILVVDDGSTDGSATVAQSFPMVRYLWQPQAGASVARNHGVSVAQGELLAFLDADDLWLPDKLAQQLAHLQSNPAVDMVFGQVEQFYAAELADAVDRPPLPGGEQMAGYHVGTMLIWRTAFEKVGPFDPQWQVAHFIEWYRRATNQGLQHAVLPAVVMKRRIHTTNLGIREHDRARREYLTLVKRQLVAQREHASPKISGVTISKFSKRT